MSDDLLEGYYQRELAFLRKLGGEFAEAHPKIAGRLKLGNDVANDPHVERMIEAVAFLNARVRMKIEDDLPELTDALLGALAPHALAPTPSMAIVQMECDPTLSTGYTVAAGTTIETDPIEGDPVRFRTAYPATSWPIRVESAALLGPTAPAPRTPRVREAKSVLRLVLQSRGETPLAQILAPRPDPTGRPGPTPRLRFFLKGAAQETGSLYELLFNQRLEAALATGPADAEPALLPEPALTPVGFSAEEGMVPYSPRVFPGHRLLNELFTFPAKFLFFDLAELPAAKLAKCGRSAELFLYLSRSVPALEQAVRAETFVLGCAPVVNLFPRRAEPTRITGADAELRVVPDARRPRAVEVWSIDRVVATSTASERREYLPLHGITHDPGAAERGAFFTASRRPAGDSRRKTDQGTEVWLSLVDVAGNPSAPDQWVLDVETTCLSRDLPNQLPFGGGQPRLRFAEGGGPIKRIECLTAPTPTRRPPLRERSAWRLLSGLTLNHLSLSAKSSVMRVSSGGEPGFCKGTDVTLQLAEAGFAGTLYLFATVIERFLGLYAALNSYVRLTVTTDRREGALRRWPPRAGDQPIL
jgi:type VI secretion system protein ImpG